MKHSDKTYCLTTFGCQMNLADSQRIRGVLAALNYREVAQESAADLVIFNTCCIRENAEQRLIGRIQTLSHEKKRQPNLLIAVGGCVAQKHKQALFDLLPMLDIAFGPNDIEQLPDLIYKAQLQKSAGTFIEKGSFDGEHADGIILSRPFSAMVNIIRGCTNFCAYCIVPFVRGPEISRSPDEIIKFISDLASKGVKEITLLGQNVNSYGKDLGLNEGFANLLEAVDKIDGIEWVRFMTSHPRDFSKNIIERMANLKKLCLDFHLPVQSGSDKILNMMGRGYSVSHYLNLVDFVREKIPDVSVTTDIICGFPGETEKDFGDTLSLVKRVRFESAFMYFYSPRGGTKAEKMSDQVEEPVRKERLARLIDLQHAISLENSQKLLNQELELLVESFSSVSEDRLVGKTKTGRIVDFIGDSSLIGKFVKVKITKARNWTLSGEIIK